ncbi:hypothetical protein D3C84_939350 [compost metagenome]
MPPFSFCNKSGRSISIVPSSSTMWSRGALLLGSSIWNPVILESAPTWIELSALLINVFNTTNGGVARTMVPIDILRN